MIELLWNAPVSEQSMSRYIDALDLRDNARVLDVGCGCGEVLIRVCRRYQSIGLGVDSSQAFLAEARRRASSCEPDLRISFDEADARSLALEEDSFDLVMCLGATHAFGLGPDAVERALGKMRSLVAAGGQILLADGYMKRPASPQYRQRIGDSIPDNLTHPSIIHFGHKYGLTPLAAWTSGVDEWDDFEWSYQRIVERKALEHPADDEVSKDLMRRRDWIDAYLKWGRDTLGYGTYLFRK